MHTHCKIYKGIWENGKGQESQTVGQKERQRERRDREQGEIRR